MMGSTTTSDPHVRTANGYSILTTTATYRSSSTSAMTSTRPQTLNVNNLREVPTLEAEYFISEALNAWRAKARCNVVPADRVQELFHELQFHPNERQISDMLQTAKKFARKGSREWNGLTFGEFCVLAADLKRFRTTNFISTSKKTRGLCCQNFEVDSIHGLSYSPSTSAKIIEKSRRANSRSFKLPNDRIKKSYSDTITSGFTSPSESGTPVEVFLGGSCNPTTWRKDVAIPALKKLGISFYNPQVSDWTPDLIELEHKAKEKARVLFFVMDSETRASAGAIEAAHIAGQNSKQLVLVLHPYRPDQYILNEPLSHQEFIDLTRNQQILRELVSRRGLPVLDSIPLGLQRTKEILAGISDPPSNIASILIVVRGAFDRVNKMHDTISLEQCQRALSILGYAQSFLTLENLKGVISTQNNILQSSYKQFAGKKSYTTTSDSFKNSIPERHEGHAFLESKCQIDFDKFCILAAYLSVLQQEIHESGCISPIKGTNVPPPPVYLTNLQGFQTRHVDDNITVNYSTKQTFQTSCNTDITTNEQLYDFVPDNRDSGTSSPQPIESISGSIKSGQTSSRHCLKKSIQVQAAVPVGNFGNITVGEESDSNDSVFSSSGSSINSNCCSGDSAFSSFEIRDVYLGGSCYLRTKWRQDCAIPYLKSKNISFHLPALHESIQPSQFDLPEKSFEDSNSQGRKQNGLNLTDQLPYQKNHTNAKISHEESSYRNHLNTRPNLYNPSLMDSSRVLLFIITNETRSLAPMTLAAHCIGLMYNVVLCVQMLPENCVIGNEKLTSAAIKDYNRGRSYLIDLAKRQGVPVFNDLKSSLECTVNKVKALHSQKKYSEENVVMKSGSAGVK